MSERGDYGLWGMRAIFLGLVAVVLFFQLLPLYTAPKGWTGPDLVLAFSLAWCARRPDHLPPLLLAGTFFLCDLLLQRPPGLWAALMLIACEYLKGQARILRDAGLFTEIFTISLCIIGVGLGYRFILAVLLVDVPPLGLSAIQTFATLAAYPLAVLVLAALLGVRRTAPGDLERTSVGGRT